MEGELTMSKARMATANPSAKVWAATAAALASPILLGLLAKAFPDIPLPADANDLAQQFVQGLVLGIVTFLAGYAKKPAARDQVVTEGAPPPTPPPA